MDKKAAPYKLFHKSFNTNHKKAQFLGLDLNSIFNLTKDKATFRVNCKKPLFFGNK